MTHIISLIHPHTHHIVTPGFVDRPRRSVCTAGQIDGEADWWTTSGKIGLSPLAMAMGVVRQHRVRWLTDFNMYMSEIKIVLFLRYFDN